MWHLKDIKKKLVLKGKADHNLIDKPLAQFEIDFKNNKNRKGWNSHKTTLGLNNLDNFRKKVCYILMFEGNPHDCPKIAPL